jgi:hypothetical protein
VVKRDGLYYALTATPFAYPDGKDYVMDGVMVLDESGALLQEWDTTQVLNPLWGPENWGFYWLATFPGTRDYAHANSIDVDGTKWLISFEALDTVIQVDADDIQVDPAAVDWVLAGSDLSPLKRDWSIGSRNGSTSQLEFSGQHNVHWTEDGQISMFDNEPGDDARALEMALFDRRADITSAWQLKARCAIMGSAYRLPDGSELLTCGTEGTFTEFDPTGEMRWEMTPSCKFPSPGLLYRGIPVDL